MFPTWKTFLEKKGCDIEDMEEKLGKDLDNDQEKGEPQAHKKKVFGKAVPPQNADKEDEDEEDE